MIEKIKVRKENLTKQLIAIQQDIEKLSKVLQEKRIEQLKIGGAILELENLLKELKDE